jgi:multiple sugar transport system permease protein
MTTPTGRSNWQRAYVYGIFLRLPEHRRPADPAETAYLDGRRVEGFTASFAALQPLSAALSMIAGSCAVNSYLWPMIVIRSSEKQLLS